jgi:alkylation response protein AidB-like acyl-CoA dehydrogenase
MLLALGQDQELFVETTGKLLDELVPVRELRRLRHHPDGFDQEYWRRGADLGWTSLLVSEVHGGGSRGRRGHTARHRSPGGVGRARRTPAGRFGEPYVRDLVGEARMLELVDRALRRRIGEGVATGTMADQSAAIGRLFEGTTRVRTHTIALEIAGAGGAAWTDDDGELGFIGTDYLMRQVSCIAGGTTEMARNVISERVLGMPRERSLDRDVPFRDLARARRGPEPRRTVHA